MELFRLRKKTTVVLQWVAVGVACIAAITCVQKARSVLGRHVIEEITLRDRRVAQVVQRRTNLLGMLIGDVPTDVELQDLDGVMHRVRVCSDDGILQEMKLVENGEYLLVGEGQRPLGTIDMVMRPKLIRGAWTYQYIRELKRGRAVTFRDPNSMCSHTLDPVRDHSVLNVGDMVLCRVNRVRCFRAIAAIDGDRFQIDGFGWAGRQAIFGKSVSEDG